MAERLMDVDDLKPVFKEIGVGSNVSNGFLRFTP